MLRNLLFIGVFFAFFLPRASTQMAPPVDSIMQIGQQYENVGDFHRAIPYYEQAYQISKSRDSILYEELFDVRAYLGFAYAAEGQNRKAIDHLFGTLNYLEPEVPSGYGAYLKKSLSLLYKNEYEGDFRTRPMLDSALYYGRIAFEEAPQVFEPGHLVIKECEVAYGIAAFHSNRHQVARNRLTSAYRKDLQQPELAPYLIMEIGASLGHIYNAKNQHDSAYYYFQLELDIRNQSGQKKPADMGKCYINLALEASILAQHNEAVELVKKSVAIYEKQAFSNDAFRFYFLAGQIMKDASDYPKTEEYYLKALENLKGKNELEPSAYVYIYEANMKMNRIERANIYIEKACQSARSYFGENDQRTYRWCLAWETSQTASLEAIREKIPTYGTMDYEEILDSLKHDFPGLAIMLEGAEASQVSAAYDKAFASQMEAMEAFLADDLEVALNRIQCSFPDLVPGFQDTTNLLVHPNATDFSPYPTGFLGGLYLKAIIQSKRASPQRISSDPAFLASTENLFAKVDSLIRMVRYQGGGMEFPELYNDAFNQVFISQANFYQRAYEVSGQKAYLLKQIEALEKRKGAFFRDQVEAKWWESTQDLSGTWQQQEANWQNSIVGIRNEMNMILAEIPLLPKKDEAEAQQLLAATKKRYLEAVSGYQSWEYKIRDENPDFRWKNFDFLDSRIQEVQQHLNQETAFVSYYVTEEGFVAYTLVTQGRGIEYEVIGQFEDWQQDVALLVQAIQDRQSTQDELLAVASRLGQKLLPQLPYEVSHLVICPDRALSSIPFAALLSADAIPGAGWSNQPFWGMQWALSYTLSPAIWIGAMERQTIFDQEWTLTAFSGSKGAQASDYFRARASLPTVRYFAGEQASKSQFIQEAAKGSQVMHLVSHGASADEGQLGYIILKNEEERITYPELFQMQLNHDLLFLGACHTGLGDYHAGEGYLSMSRGAIFAGADNVIVSKVALFTKSDGLFVQSFYDQLLGKVLPVSYAFAVQNAQRIVLNQKDFGHPYYWAGYYLEGR